MQTRRNIRSVQKPKNNFGFKDFFVIVIFLSVAVLSVIIFRLDLYRTIESQTQEPIGTVIVKQNTVQRRLGDRVLWDRLRQESPVYIGDLIRIAEQSEAMLNVEGISLDLDENTLVRIVRSLDGGSFEIQLDSGSLSLVASEDSPNIVINLNGQKIMSNPGTALSASASDTGMSVVVSEGTATVVAAEDSGAPQMVLSPSVVFAMDNEGNEVVQKAAVVTSPLPNARFLNNKNEPFNVDFAWNRINLVPGELLRMEISSNRDFNQVTRRVNGLYTQAQVSLANGLWYWRLLLGNEVLSDGRLTVVDAAGVQLQSPAVNSLLRFSDDLPSVNFQWTEAESASSYLLEVSNNSNFYNPVIQSQRSTNSYTDNSLGEGIWYWRVRPDFPAGFDGGGSFSQVSFFRVEKTSVEAAAAAENISLEQLIAEEAPSKTVPPEVPQDVVPQELRPPPPPPPEPSAPPPPPPPLPRPSGLSPANGLRYEAAQLVNMRNIVFRWSAVQGANAYIFTLYQQTANGRRQVVSTPPRSATNYTIDDLRVLDRGTFIWTVEAVVTGRGGEIERRGTAAESTFVMNFRAPTTLEIEEAGILYGN